MHSKVGRGRRALAVTAALGLVLVACGGDDEPTDTGEAAEEPADGGEEATGDDGAAADPDAFADAPEVEVVFGHPFPDQHHLAVNVLQPWMDEVTEMTNGTVTFDVQPAGALSGPPDNYEHPAAGVTDMGWALHGYTPGQFPITQVIELPFVFDSAVQGTEVLWDLYEEFPEFQEEYRDVQVLALWAHDVGDLFTTSSPVESTDDVRGLSIRTPAPMQNALVETLGGSAVGMPAPELYDSLDRGVIDGLLIGHSGVPTFGLEEVLGHVTRGNFFVGTMFVVMNPATWESMSPEQQAVFEETAFENLSMALAEDMDRVGGEAVDQFEEWGFEIHELDEAQLQEWRDATAGVPQSWIDSMPDDVPAQEMYDRMIELAGVN
ncbi:TRAP transporter substrate-binding protein [Egicoccus sp. AB-alg2]|uniref:TRAP transporter substrate-binding protein n=1 Tax=Egicoccus sp. AB-alg2 TaxID=3242693 RepID=UPI00359E5136